MTSSRERLTVRRQAIDAAMDAALAERTATLGALVPHADDLLHGIRTLLAGGKRIRPLCLSLGVDAVSDSLQLSEADLRMAVSLELFHAAALLHDDVMDRSDTRRGNPALHRQLASTSRHRGWHTDHDQFGVSGAILAGDLCLAWSESHFSCQTQPPPPACLELFADMRGQLIVGQYLDMTAQAGSLAELTVHTALHVAEHKTARYTVAYPMMLGAAAHGGDKQTLARLEAFGTAVGIAFQLRDDLLGVFGDPEETGKPAGDDIREGKKTALIALAVKNMSAADMRTLDAILGRADADEKDIDICRALLRDYDAPALTEALITDHRERAREIADTFATRPICHENMLALIDIATRRTT